MEKSRGMENLSQSSDSSTSDVEKSIHLLQELYKTGKKEGLTLSRDELVDLIGRAESLYQADQAKKEATRYGQALDSLSDESRYPIEVYFRAAASVDIPLEYAKKALDSRHPSIDTQIAEIERYDAKPSNDSVLRFLYKTYAQAINRAFEESVPDKMFRAVLMEGEYGGLSLEVRKRSHSRIKDLWYALTQKDLGSVFIHHSMDGSFNVEIQSFDPIFLHTCGEALADLGSRFKRTSFCTLDEQKIEYNHPSILPEIAKRDFSGTNT